MSNLERKPTEMVCEPTGAVGGPKSALSPVLNGLEILTPREVPLGGPRAMTVHRTLPQRRRSLIGAWCFIDHYGPDDVAASGGMRVPPHPHTGLQTVSWLFEGEIEHRDSVGTHAMVRPGELNLMTAGRGISHSEVSTPATSTLHGAQLWLALPAGERDRAPFFENTTAERANVGEARLSVFIGVLAGVAADATVFSPLVGGQIELPAGCAVTLPLDPAFEHGILLDTGDVRIGDANAAAETDVVDLPPRHLAYLAPGHESLALSTTNGARLLLVGGVPFGEQIVMWWNFIGRSHEEILDFRDRWQRDVIGQEDTRGRFGTVDHYDGSPLPAPELPTVRLKPRG